MLIEINLKRSGFYKKKREANGRPVPPRSLFLNFVISAARLHNFPFKGLLPSVKIVFTVPNSIVFVADNRPKRIFSDLRILVSAVCYHPFRNIRMKAGRLTKPHPNIDQFWRFHLSVINKGRPVQLGVFHINNRPPDNERETDAVIFPSHRNRIAFVLICLHYSVPAAGTGDCQSVIVDSVAAAAFIVFRTGYCRLKLIKTTAP